MAWDTSVSSGDIITSVNHNERTTAITARSKVSSGAGIPSSTPSSIGDMYIDTTNLKIYISTGTSSSADWKKVISQ